MRMLKCVAVESMSLSRCEYMSRGLCMYVYESLGEGYVFKCVYVSICISEYMIMFYV